MKPNLIVLALGALVAALVAAGCATPMEPAADADSVKTTEAKKSDQ